MILYLQVCCQYWLTTKMKYSKYQVVSQCNNEEGNTRTIFHVLQQKTNVAVYSKDADVLIVFAYDLNKINEK